MGAEHLSYVKSIATYAPTFFRCIISVLASLLPKEANAFLYYYFSLSSLDDFVKGPDHLAPGLGHPGRFLCST